jgi:hypothetical protein
MNGIENRDRRCWRAHGTHAAIEATLHDSEATLVAALDQPGVPAEGKDAGELVGMPCGVPVSSDRDAGIAWPTA